MTPLLRFELLRRLRWRPLPLLAAGYLAAVALAHLFGSSADPGLPAEVTVLGMQLVWLFALASWLGADRGLGFDELLTANLVSPARYVLSKVIVLAILVVALHAAVLVTVAAVSPGSLEAMLLTVTEIALLAFALAPFVLLAELVVETRVPMAYVAVVWFGGLVVGLWIGFDPETMAGWLGITESGGLGEFARRAGALAVLGTAAVYPVALWRVSPRGAHRRGSVWPMERGGLTSGSHE